MGTRTLDPSSGGTPTISFDRHWTSTLISATLAVGLAALGLGLDTIAPTVGPAGRLWLLIASLAATGIAFVLLALRVRRLELEREGLIEELSQEFDQVRDRLSLYSDTLAPFDRRSAEEVDNTTVRRISIK